MVFRFGLRGSHHTPTIGFKFGDYMIGTSRCNVHLISSGQKFLCRPVPCSAMVAAKTWQIYAEVARDCFDCFGFIWQEPPAQGECQQKSHTHFPQNLSQPENLWIKSLASVPTTPRPRTDKPKAFTSTIKMHKVRMAALSAGRVVLPTRISRECHVLDKSNGLAQSSFTNATQT